MRMIDSSHDCLPFVDRICPLIIMQVSVLHNIHLILIHQFFQMHGQISFLGVSVQVGRIEGSVCAYNDPLDVRIISCLAKIFFEEFVLLRAVVIGMLRGEMHEVYLSIVEGEVKIGLMRKGPWQYVSVNITCISAGLAVRPRWICLCPGSCVTLILAILISSQRVTSLSLLESNESKISWQSNAVIPCSGSMRLKQAAKSLIFAAPSPSVSQVASQNALRLEQVTYASVSIHKQRSKRAAKALFINVYCKLMVKVVNKNSNSQNNLFDLASTQGPKEHHCGPF